MTMQMLHSQFPCIWWKFDFFYQCLVLSWFSCSPSFYDWPSLLYLIYPSVSVLFLSAPILLMLRRHFLPLSFCFATSLSLWTWLWDIFGSSSYTVLRLFHAEPLAPTTTQFLYTTVRSSYPHFVFTSIGFLVKLCLFYTTVRSSYPHSVFTSFRLLIKRCLFSLASFIPWINQPLSKSMEYASSVAISSASLTPSPASYPLTPAPCAVNFACRTLWLHVWLQPLPTLTSVPP